MVGMHEFTRNPELEELEARAIAAQRTGTDPEMRFNTGDLGLTYAVDAHESDSIPRGVANT